MEQNRASIGENGKLIRRTLYRMYPGAAIYGLLFNVMLIIDSVIAGSNLGPDGVAAVAIGIPAYGVLLALMLVIRTMGTPYNPLDFEPDKDTFSKMGVSMVQRIAKEVTYTNVYKLNVVTITVDA